MAVTEATLKPVPETFASIEQAVEAIARGEIVIVVDAPNRENEGDFVMAAEKVTPDAVNFMVTHGRGLLCLPMSGERLDALKLRAMVPENEAGAETAFTISIDMRAPRNTGISAVDLARLAGCKPAGAICEIMNEDGTMARVPDLVEVARRHGLLMISIEDLIAYRARTEAMVRRAADARIPTPYGEFTAVGFESDIDGREHIALVYGNPEGSRGALVRVHSDWLTCDAFGSLRCDCGAQLGEPIRLSAPEG